MSICPAGPSRKNARLFLLSARWFTLVSLHRCSLFLQTFACLLVCLVSLAGLCTNTACPYRHVKVNSNAPVCEDFLKGYCADGDEVFMMSLEIYYLLLNFYLRTFTLNWRVSRCIVFLDGWNKSHCFHLVASVDKIPWQN